MNKETAPVGKIVAPKGGSAPAAAPVAKFAPSVQRNRVIPGMAPPGAAPAPASNAKKAPAGSAPANTGAKSAPKAAAPAKVSIIY